MPKLIVEQPATPTGLPRADSRVFGGGAAQGLGQLGRTVSRSAEILNAASDARGSINATRYRLEYEQAAQEILTNPNNLYERDSLLADARRKLVAKHRGKIGTVAFDREAGLIDRQVSGFVTNRTNLEAIEQAQADTIDKLDELADRWAQASGDLEEQSLVEQMASNRIEAAHTSGIIGDDLGREYLERFDQRRGRAMFTRLLREDPGKAARILSQPVDGFDEIQRQEMLTQSLRAYQSRLKAERQAIEDAERAEKDAFKLQAAEIERDFIEADAAGTLTVPMVTSQVDNLSPDVGRQWLDRARGGGEGGSSKRNPSVWLDLDTRARAGDPTVEEDANRAYRMGEITQADYRSIVDDDLSARHGDPKRRLLQSFDTGATILDGAAASALAARRDRAIDDLEVWLKANPEASREDAMERARHISKTAQFIDPESIGVFNLQPTQLRRGPATTTGPGPIDFDATKDAIEEAVERGELSEFGAEYEHLLLDRLMRLERQNQPEGAQ